MKPTLAKNYDPFTQDPTGWLMSEKLDGVRALWDGSRLVSRNGNPFPAPAEWLAKLPKIALDGELWIGRGQFQSTLSAVKRGDFSRLKYRVFDAPTMPGCFYDRLSAISGHGEKNQWIPIAHEFCGSHAHLERYFQSIVNDGGEGLMLRDPAMPYIQGRTNRLLKYKPADDSEGILITTEPGTGKLSGLVGTFVLKWGRHLVRVGSGIPDKIRLSPPPAGAKITFGFCGLTDSGLPRFPVFHAVRNYE